MELDKQATVWSGKSCIWCVRVIDLLENNGYKVTKYTVTLDKTMEEFQRALPGVKTVPQVFIDNKHIGGFKETEKYLSECVWE